MKKLKLKALELGAIEVLSREQLRQLGGGYGSSSSSSNGYTAGCGHNINTCNSGDVAYASWCGSYQVCRCLSVDTTGIMYCRKHR